MIKTENKLGERRSKVKDAEENEKNIVAKLSLYVSFFC